MPEESFCTPRYTCNKLACCEGWSEIPAPLRTHTASVSSASDTYISPSYGILNSKSAARIEAAKALHASTITPSSAVVHAYVRAGCFLCA